MPTVTFTGGPLDGLRMNFADGKEPPEVEFRLPCLTEGGCRFAQYAEGPAGPHALHHYATFSEPQLVLPQHCFDCEVVGWMDPKGHWAAVGGSKLKQWAVIEELTGGF